MLSRLQEKRNAGTFDQPLTIFVVVDGSVVENLEMPTEVRVKVFIDEIRAKYPKCSVMGHLPNSPVIRVYDFKNKNTGTHYKRPRWSIPEQKNLPAMVKMHMLLIGG